MMRLQSFVVDEDGNSLAQLPTDSLGHPILPAKDDVIVLVKITGIYDRVEVRRLVLRIEWRFDLGEILVFTKEVEK